MKNKKTKKTFEIDSLEKLLNVVNKENIERLGTDLLLWMDTYLHYIDTIKELHPKETKGLLNCEISKATFTWVDDGKNDLIGIDLTSPKTGEKVRVEIS